MIRNHELTPSPGNPAFTIPCQELNGTEAEFIRFFSSALESQPTPELLVPTNPVPEFMESLGLAHVHIPHTIEPDLMNKTERVQWDGTKHIYFLIRHVHLKSPFNAPSFPGPTIRVPRGAIFHAKTHAHGPPPHTIHWHGIEPTSINDGVGHCSMELGDYTYQWQPNFIGTYFYHCHRSTVQHFKFGLYGGLIIEPPDAFLQGPGRNPGGYPRRIAAELDGNPDFPGFIGGEISNENPHAHTVPYDVEAFWAIDDKDSRWADLMPDPRTENARPGKIPGKDELYRKADFHDFNPNYFFVTGQGFPGKTSATLPDTDPIPAALNSGVTGMQISVKAKINQTILIRVLCAAYSAIRITFPLSGMVIAFDGRALGVPTNERYNRPIPLPAGEPITITTARRFDILIRSKVPIDDFAVVEFLSHRDRSLLFTGKIPIRITD